MKFPPERMVLIHLHIKGETMNRTFRYIALTLAVTSGACLSACNPDTKGIDPQILAHLKTPCAGEIVSSFHESASDWSVTVSCIDRKKIETRKEELRKGLRDEVEPRTDGFDPLKY